MDDLHKRIDALGLAVTHYIRNGSGEYQPADLVGHKGDVTRLVVFRETDMKYGFDGWEPWASKPFASHGGRYQSLAAAISWFEWLERQTP